VYDKQEKELAKEPEEKSSSQNLVNMNEIPKQFSGKETTQNH